MECHSLTIIIPAYNEEPTLAAVVGRVARLSEKYVADYEIIIVNDASTDRTGMIADELASKNSKVQVIHNAHNMNMGYNFRRGLSFVHMEYVCMVPGDDDVTEETLDRLIRATGNADLILAYHTNYEARHPIRRVVSKLFVVIMNFVFRLRIRYYNGPAVLRAELLRSIPMTTSSFAFMAEIVVRLLKQGYMCIEVPMTLKPERKGVNWRVFRPKNTWGVIKTIALLRLDMFKNKSGRVKMPISS